MEITRHWWKCKTDIIVHLNAELWQFLQIDTNRHPVISLKYMYTYGIYKSKGTVLRCVSCRYKSQYFLLDFLLNIFFFCDFLDNALYIIRTRLGNVCVKMYLWYCYSAMVVILCAAALTSQWGTRLYYMNDSPIVSCCYS